MSWLSKLFGGKRVELATPVDPADEASPQFILRDTLAALVKNHKFAATIEEDGVVVHSDADEPPIVLDAEVVSAKQSTGRGAIVQLLFSTKLPDGRTIQRSESAMDADVQKAFWQAVEAFSQSTLHVLLAGLLRADPELAPIETRTIGGQARQVTAGRPLHKVMGKPSGPGDWQARLAKAMQDADVPPGLHWVDVFHVAVSNGARELQILLDNVPWRGVEQAMTGATWPAADPFCSVRQFIIIHG